jgi:hypothetical protein
MSSVRAVVDACALIPLALCDTLLARRLRTSIVSLGATTFWKKYDETWSTST